MSWKIAIQYILGCAGASAEAQGPAGRGRQGSDHNGKLSEHRGKLGIVAGGASAEKAQLEEEIRNFHNFKVKRSSFSRTFSLFTLDGYGKVVFDPGMTTGSSTWTIGGWTSLVLPLGSTVSFVTSASTSTPGGEF
ncbi:hypothetical protein Tco_1504922 [Tanacetum coccineum]